MKGIMERLLISNLILTSLTLILFVIFNVSSSESHPDENQLSDWEIFTMALVKVESEFDSTAVSSAGAKGYFQITPIYVKEVNRLHNTDYTFDQVTNFNDSYEIFLLMQDARNSDYDFDTALELHNGKHKWYKKRVYKEMENIRRYEKVRNQLKSHNHKK